MSLPIYVVELINWNKSEHEKIRSRMYSFDDLESRKAARDLARQIINYHAYLQCFGYRSVEHFMDDDEVEENIIPYDEWKQEMYKNIPEHLRRIYEMEAFKENVI